MNAQTILKITDCKEKKEKKEQKMEDAITADTYSSCARICACTRRNLRCNFLLKSKVYYVTRLTN